MIDEDFAEAMYQIAVCIDYRWGPGHDHSAGIDYENDVFKMVQFRYDHNQDCPSDWGNWDEGVDECNCPAGLPNFTLKSNGLEVTWYKRMGRSTESSIAMSPLRWYRAVIECIESVRDDPREEI